MTRMVQLQTKNSPSLRWHKWIILGVQRKAPTRVSEWESSEIKADNGSLMCTDLCRINEKEKVGEKASIGEGCQKSGIIRENQASLKEKE